MSERDFSATSQPQAEKAKIKDAETEKNQKKARDIAEQRPGAGSPV